MNWLQYQNNQLCLLTQFSAMVLVFPPKQNCLVSNFTKIQDSKIRNWWLNPVSKLYMTWFEHEIRRKKMLRTHLIQVSIRNNFHNSIHEGTFVYLIIGIFFKLRHSFHCIIRFHNFNFSSLTSAALKRLAITVLCIFLSHQ